MCADDHIDAAGFEHFYNFLLVLRSSKPRKHLDASRKRAEPLLESLEVLKDQNRGRREDCYLLAFHNRLESGSHRHFGLAVAHIADDQPIHRLHAFHARLHVFDGGFLIGSESVLERVFELVLPGSVLAVGVTLNQFALGVELQQLFGHVAHRAFSSGLRLLPADAAKLIKRRFVPFVPRVPLDKIQPLDRNIEPRAFRVSQQHELANIRPRAFESGGHVAGSRAGGRYLSQPLKLPDPVIDVHDVVADFQVAEVREKRGSFALFARALWKSALLRGHFRFAEDVALGQQVEIG